VADSVVRSALLAVREGETKASVARRLGVSYNTVLNWTSGRTRGHVLRELEAEARAAAAPALPAVVEVSVEPEPEDSPPTVAELVEEALDATTSSGEAPRLTEAQLFAIGDRVAGSYKGRGVYSLAYEDMRQEAIAHALHVLKGWKPKKKALKPANWADFCAFRRVAHQIRRASVPVSCRSNAKTAELHDVRKVGLMISAADGPADEVVERSMLHVTADGQTHQTGDDAEHERSSLRRQVAARVLELIGDDEDLLFVLPTLLPPESTNVPVPCTKLATPDRPLSWCREQARRLRALMANDYQLYQLSLECA
jgi:transposase-like protein